MSLCEQNKLGVKEGDKISVKAEMVVTGFFEQHDTGVVIVYLEFADEPHKYTLPLSSEQVARCKKDPEALIKIICEQGLTLRG